jgi:crossover junction endodeoxyribonuclease RusA
MITIRLPYPVSANKYWRTMVMKGRAVTYVSSEARSYKQAVAWIAIAAGVRPVHEHVALKIVLHPKTTKHGEASKICLDLDNSIKVTCDALNGIAYNDDSQVKRIEAEYGEAIKDGGMTVTISNHKRN